MKRKDMQGRYIYRKRAERNSWVFQKQSSCIIAARQAFIWVLRTKPKVELQYVQARVATADPQVIMEEGKQKLFDQRPI